MVDFRLSEEQEMIRDMTREFCNEEVVPNAEEWDKNGTYPLEAITKAHDLGLLSVTIPKKYGGAGMSSVDEMIICEEMSRGDPGFGTASYHTTLASFPILTGGTEEQKKEYLGRTAEGKLAAYCVTEPDAGSDVQSLKTEAKKEGDEYVINGNKAWISGAGYADWFFVLAYTDRSAGYGGLSGFIVDSDTRGIELGKKEANMGQRCSDTRGVSFKDVRVPESNLVGGVENGGWLNAMRAFDHSRPAVAAAAVGNARGAMEEAWTYAKQRRTFGKPISKHQSISFMLADMATKIEAARLLTFSAANALDSGESATLKAAHAKRFAADICMEVTTDAVQVLGGYGYSEEYPVARRMRGAKIYQIFEGTSQIQRMIISRELDGFF
ncbi:MAG TPA: acyl-CoA dehydrogenase family protein [Candidatus Thalassarchaeaceae archaeon]|nr:acyl-CoA dehydrogenase family protein [Candidatus Thalassarchaeaceae archaeon]